jgi:hypothetical protein
MLASDPVVNFNLGCFVHTWSKLAANGDSPHSVQICATVAFKRGFNENEWDCSDCVGIKIRDVNCVSIQVLIDMVMTNSIGEKF